MGILDKVGEIVGAVAAVETTKKVDPGAGLLTEAAAAVAGFEGAGKLEEMVEKKDDEKKEEQQADDGTQQADSGDSQT